MTGEHRVHIQCSDLFKIYKRAELEVVALRGLDMEVAHGEFLAIIGSSGSGKTTLLNILAGLDVPSAGQIRVGDRDLLDMTEEDRVTYRRLEVGFVWQTTSRNLLPYLTARENIELPMAISGEPAAERRERAMDLLAVLGLEDKAARYPYQLSGGEQQRVAIGEALANRPALLLADEPTGELDTSTADEVLQALQDVRRSYNVTVVIVTHYAGVGRFTDRVVLIRDGRIASETVVEASYQRPGETVQEEYLVIDRVGRLQLPAESMERLRLTGLARVEKREDGVVIRPREGGA
jgi:ABC-type lipoprotein export system ATPase subunit